MSVFADSSAAVKLYSDELGHDAVRALTGLVVSAVARVEVTAALWRKQRLGELSPEGCAVLVAAFEADYLDGRLPAVACGAEVLERAAGLTAALTLRAYDAVQLASAIAAREADPTCTAFACFDDELRGAAARSGFELIPG